MLTFEMRLVADSVGGNEYVCVCVCVCVVLCGIVWYVGVCNGG